MIKDDDERFARYAAVAQVLVHTPRSHTQRPEVSVRTVLCGWDAAWKPRSRYCIRTPVQYAVGIRSSLRPRTIEWRGGRGGTRGQARSSIPFLSVVRPTDAPYLSTHCK